jgi:hypothetical protein
VQNALYGIDVQRGGSNLIYFEWMTRTAAAKTDDDIARLSTSVADRIPNPFN